jgi:7 transmembrane sweet-taste receptor of 3 GCPR
MDPSVEEVQVSSVDIIKAGAILVGSNFLLLFTWSLVSPLEWTRVKRQQTDSFKRLVESYAVCNSDKSVGFVVGVVILNVAFLARGSLWAYRTRNLATEYNESRYVGLVIAGVLQVWLMGLPVVLALRTLPFATFFVKSGIIVLTSGIVVLLVFLPKAVELYKDRGLNAQELRQLYLSYRKFSTMQMQRFDDNDDSTDFQAPESNSHLPIAESGRLAQDASNRERSVPESSSARRIKIIHNPRVRNELDSCSPLVMT